MKLTLFGASGALGSECLKSALRRGHEITVLVRNRESLAKEIITQINAVEGDVLELKDVEKVISKNTDAVIFAIGMKRNSIDYLCTEASRIIVSVMNEKKIKKFIFASGASTIMRDEKKTFGKKVIIAYASLFMKKKHLDKQKQLEFLMEHKEIAWQGIRPAKIVKGKAKGEYRLGEVDISPLSVISFTDCAEEMINMAESDKWNYDLPYICY